MRAQTLVLRYGHLRLIRCLLSGRLELSLNLARVWDCGLFFPWQLRQYRRVRQTAPRARGQHFLRS